MNLNKIESVDSTYINIDQIRNNATQKKNPVKDRKQETALDFDSIIKKEDKANEPQKKLLTEQEEESLKVVFQDKRKMNNHMAYSKAMSTTGLFLDLRG
ncbi:MAG: hypothetical protein HN641_04215 [Candidatus Marinimicrobia bacterium]|nr:hypothetical protein [Candidatus Neomarinimicrobiota bacterium]MBT7883028.1 hypothetical protein [Candidatus Neomarinimicrobiota bacterium]